MEIVVTDSGSITVYPVPFYKGQFRHLEIKVASRCVLGRKPNKKLRIDCAFILSNAPFGTRAATTVERGDCLQYPILKVEVETGIRSRLSAVIQALEPHSGRFFRRIYFRHKRLVSLELLSVGAPLDDGLEMENNLVASDSRLCINPQVKAVPGCSHKCQFILQNVALLFLITTSHCYNLQE